MATNIDFMNWIGKPKSAETVVDGSDDDVIVGSQGQAVVDFECRCSAHVTTTVDPDQHSCSLFLVSGSTSLLQFQLTIVHLQYIYL